MDAAVDARLNAIEGEVRRIADSLQLLIRVDERVVTLFNGYTELKGRVSILEGRSGRDHWTVSAFTKFGWIIASPMLAFGFTVAKDRLQAPAPTYVPSQDHAGKPPRNDGK